MNTTVKTTEPKIEERAELPYAAIRTQISMDEMGSGIIPQLHDEVIAWLEQRGLKPAGPPLMRYHVIDMPGRLDISIGWPIEKVVPDDDRVTVDSLPAGRYASLIFTDLHKGVEGNGVLIVWAKDQGLEWDAWDEPEGHAFRSRVEFTLTEPDDEPDISKWETEVAIKLADS